MNCNNFLKIFLLAWLDLLAFGQITKDSLMAIEEIPYMVQIYENGEFLCGGTLISDYLVLTAAHLVVYTPVSEFIVVGGDPNSTNESIEAGVIEGFWHSEFNQSIIHMDAAIMKLEKSFTNIPKPFACKANIKAGTHVKFFSWDQILDDSLSERQRTREAVIMNHDECVQLIKMPLTDSMFCTLGYENDSYAGDSGGPVFCYSCFCGTVSFYIELSGNIHVRIYTNLDYIVPFIDIVKQLTK